MTYSAPRDRPSSEIAADLSSPLAGVVAGALIDAAHFLPGEQSQAAALAMTDDRRATVRRAALVALSVIARKRTLSRDVEFWTAVRKARSDPETAGTVEDLLNDIRIYLGDEAVEL